ncbi:MAG: hypothetical protein JXM72_03160 [Deltaproteobacteria bacterium]|nr:hypothetical protein [Deltaproteobacteria bacterium]
MNREEFEHSLKEFEITIRKRLPSMINIYLANRGNREQETAFNHLVETLQRQKKVLLKDVSKVARHEQKVRYFNAMYNMDSQLRSMNNKDAHQKHMKFRHHRISAPLVYDIGEGPETGDLLNVSEDGILLKTMEKISADHEVKMSVSGKTARGKAMWSITDSSGQAETGVKLMETSEDFLKELKKQLKKETDPDA